MKKAPPYLMADPPEPSLLEGEHPDEMLTRLETFRSLDAALASLSDEHRLVFVFAEIEVLPQEASRMALERRQR